MYKEYSILEGADYWDKNWEDTAIEDRLRYVESRDDYMRPILDRFLPRQGRVLEGGCGLGSYVIYYRKMGYDVVGIDFAKETVQRLNRYDPKLPIIIGDVSKLPYPNDVFNAYISMGVVEHFEEGPYAALKEAYRVLNKDGLLIVSVPYLNFVRRLKNMGVRLRRKDSGGDRKIFHMYVFSRREILRLLKESGFDIVYTRGVSVTHGLIEHLSVERSRPIMNIFTGEKRGVFKSLLMRLRRLLKEIVRENYDIKILRPVLWLLQPISANLILVVCRKRSSQ